LLFTALCSSCTVLWGEYFSFTGGLWRQWYIFSKRNHFNNFLHRSCTRLWWWKYVPELHVEIQCCHFSRNATI